MTEDTVVADGRTEPSAAVSLRESPLSAAEEQLWYLSQLATADGAYNESVILSKSGPFNVSAFRAAFNDIVRRHEIWRSTFDIVDGEPVQVVHPAPVHELRLIDLSALPRDEAEQRVARIATAAAHDRYELTRGPLIRPLLIRVTEQDHRLYLAMHHIVFDGATLRIVARELIALYDAFAASHPSPLSISPPQYRDYATWEREWIATPDFARRIEYWRRRLADAPTMQLPFDRAPPSVARAEGAIEPFRLSKELVSSLRSLSRQHNATLFQAVAAGFVALLHRYSGQEDVVFGTIADLRHEPQFESMIGYCVTPLVVRVDVGGDPSFVDVVVRLRTDLLNGLAHLVPFERLVRELRPHREPGTSPVFQSLLAMQPPTIPSEPSWDLRPLEQDFPDAFDRAKFDLSIELDERADGHVDGRLIYNTGVFHAATAHRLAGHLTTLLEGIVQDPLAPVAELPLLSEAELRLQIVEWNATNSEHPRGVCVHDLIEDQAARAPHAVAVVCGDHSLTYAELDRRANQIAHRLRAAGAGTGTVVAIALDRSLDLVAGLLGVLKSGAAYVPLDPRHPPERLSFILEDSGATMLLTHGDLLGGLPQQPIITLCVDDSTTDEQSDTATAPQHITSPEDLAYILYTSGSTGRPKGVRVRHRNVVNLMTALAEKPGLSPDDVVLGVATHIFDMSVGDIFPTLGIGARLVLASRDDVRDPRRLSELIERSGATIMHATPVTWQMLVDAGWAGSSRLVAVSGGDTLPAGLAGNLLDRCAAVWNGYGPTETTVYASFSQVARGDTITIGRPVANATLYILDARRQPVPIGVPGEIYIGGAGVTLGYANRVDETAQHFVADRFVSGAQMYRTGDLAKFLSDGSVQHLGRIDRQVKVRGVRIEPGEIETTLIAHPAVASASVVPKRDGRGDSSLVAYIVPTDHARAAPDELRAWLRQFLPGSMVPSRLVLLDELPVTASGKVDYAALPEPPDEAPRADPTVQTALEDRVSQIWARALGLTRVGVDDNFFDLGGHSLLVVLLLTEIEKELGVELSLTSILENEMTVAGMSALIEAAQSRAGADGPVIPIQRHGTAPILFVVFPSETSMLSLRNFAGPLGSNQPLFGLLPGHSGERYDQSKSVQDLATHTLASMVAIQPEGPYYIAGYSLGGSIAYEMAGMLQARGQRVAYLGLLDASTPEMVAAHLKWLLSTRGRMVRIGEELSRGPANTLRKVRDVAARGLESLRSEMTRQPMKVTQGRFDWVGAMTVASRYVCRPHTTPMELFVSTDGVRRTGSRSLGWNRLHRGEITVHAIPGNHRSVVSEPEVYVVAETMARTVRARQAAEAQAVR